jgi:NodT family efflux transporter outer membrane factor (OMF) lipoprotein
MICLVGMVSLAGCTVGPNYRRPTAPVPATYKETGDWKTAQPNDQNLDDWWEIFQDPQLNALEAQVNVSNQNLKAAEAQYTQARALLRYYRADLFPTVTANPSATRIKTSSNRPPHSSTFNGITYNDFQIPFELSYELDVWGRVRRTVEEYHDQAQASAADLAAVNLSMHSQLALYYFQSRLLDAEEQLLNSTVAQYEQALALIQSRYAGGIASDVEVQQAETQLETTRAQTIDVGVARAQYEHAVAVLVGKPPAEFSLAPLPLTMPPGDSRGLALAITGASTRHRRCRTPNGCRERADWSSQSCLLSQHQFGRGRRI